MLETYFWVAGTTAAVCFLLLLVERLVPVETGQPAGRTAFNFLYGPFIYAVSLAALVAAGPAYALVIERTGGGLLPALGGDVGAVVLFALAYGFAWDFSQYWLHRLQHRVPFLWEIHRFHHEETALNAAAYPRAHVLGVIGVIAFNLPVIALFGLRSPHAVAAFVMFPLWGYLTHANLRLGFGRLTPLIAGPQWHRIHHSALPEHRDRNFCNLFPVIDIAFGTYYRPARAEYPPTGVAGERVGDLRGATIQPFVAWWAMLKSARSARRASFISQKASPW